MADPCFVQTVDLVRFQVPSTPGVYGDLWRLAGTGPHPRLWYWVELERRDGFFRFVVDGASVAQVIAILEKHGIRRVEALP
jgi:hypothetical protein